MALNTIIPCLSDGISSALSELNTEALRRINEIRVRRNMPLILIIGRNTYFITEKGKLLNHYSEFAYTVSEEEFDVIFRRLCNYSVHCEIDNLVNGFITTAGGNRVGVCSTAVKKGGEITSVKDVTSLNIRISSEIKNCAKPVMNILFVNELPSIIVASEPCGGKTTFLRDLARLLSSGFNNKYKKVTVIDERNEIAFRDANGIVADVGLNCGALSSFPKAKGIEIAVRALSPDYIICDEIDDLKEVEAIKDGFNSGVSFAVSVHAKTKEQLLNKPIVKALTATGEFDYIVLLNDYTNDFEILEVR